MLIGEWNNDPSSSYKIIINEKIINSKKINQHVVEAVLPRFENLTNSNNLIYVYEGQLLFCEPISFEIKASICQQVPVSYKFQLFLLERVITLVRFYKCNLDEDIQRLNENSFETRIICLVNHLTYHLNKFHSSCKENASSTQFVLNYEHEGKNLVNLCIELGYVNLFKSLKQLKMALRPSQSSYFDLEMIRNELNLFTLDHHGQNALVILDVLFFDEFNATN